MSDTLYGGFWIRLGALLVDSAICFTFFLFLNSLTDFDFRTTSLLQQMAVLIYFTAFTASSYQGTPGKILLGLYIADLSHNRLSFAKSFLRAFLWMLPGLPSTAISLLPHYHEMQQKVMDIPLGDIQAYDTLMQSQEMQNYMMMTNLTVILSVALLLVWFMPIVFTQQRTGVYDIICGTRVFKKQSDNSEG